MKSFTKASLRLCLGVGLAAVCTSQLLANVTITQPTGGQNIPADKALDSTNGPGFTALGSIVITEGASTDFAAGTSRTLVLTPPAGWQFNAGAGSVTFQGSRDISAATIAVTASNATVTVTIGGTSKLDVLTISGLQVQPLTGANAPDAGYILRLSANPGTAGIAGIQNGVTAFGLLNTVAGAAVALTMQTQPTPAAVVGVPFDPQPAVNVLDQFGNLRELDTSTVVTADRAAGTGTLQGSLTQVAIAGLVSYTNLYHSVTGTITLQFTGTNLTGVVSDPIVVGPAPASRLVFTTQPGAAVAGAPFGGQPALVTQDNFGGNTTVGLPANLPVTITLSSGTGTLLGVTTVDIGTSAGNGVVAFSDLEIDAAGTNKQLTASAAGLSNGVSSGFTVSPGPFTRLQLLLPGETAAPGTPNGKTGTPGPQTSGTAFTVTVNAVDAYWNLVNTASDLISITASDSSAVLPANGALVAGTRTFGVTLRTAGPQTLTATDITDGSKTASTSSSMTVLAGAPTRLMLQTQPSATATAGMPFAQQPVVVVQDAAGNVVGTNGLVITAARGTGTGTLQGTLAAITFNGVGTFANLAYNAAETLTVTFTSGTLASTSSSNIVVSPAAFAKLQLLAPGETAAPGTASGKTGTPTARTAGTAFNVTVNAVDAFWNVVNTVTDTVDMSSTDANAVLPADAPLINGANSLSVTFKTAGSQTLTASDVSDGSRTNNTSPAITVNAAAFAQMQLLMPGETAAPGTGTGKTGTPTPQTAGTGYNVIARAVDAYWNLIGTNTQTVGVTSTDPNDVLPASKALVAGSNSFSLTNKTAGTWVVTATNISDGTKTSANSPVTVNPGSLAKLQLLVPGEAASPGSATGKTGTPAAQTAGTAFNVTVNGVDANWNVVSAASDTVGLTSSDGNALLPANAALSSGTQTLSVTLKTAGTRTLTASDISDGTRTASTSPSISVNSGAFAMLQLLVPGETAAPGTASGKTGTPLAESAGSSFSVTVNAVDTNWNVINTVADTVGVTSSDTNAVLPANAALVSGTKAFSVTLKTLGSWTVTASDVSDAGKSANTSPPISVPAGAPSRLMIQTAPSPVATAGVVLAQQPVVAVTDASGNVVTSDNGRVITAARGSGTGNLQGSLTATTVNGLATFNNLSYNVAETITINFTAAGLTNASSGNIVVSPNTASRLAFTTQPGGVSRTGSILTTQPVVKAQDQFGNASTAGLPASLPLSLALTTGSGSLLGTTTFDIGTTAGNGVATCTNLQCSDAGTNKQLTGSASGLTSAVSSNFTVGGIARATGGSAISADTVGGSYTPLTGPAYFEAASGDVGTGTIILSAPAGFVFDTNTPAPTVVITRLTGSGGNANNINAAASGTAVAVTSKTTSQITFTITSSSASGVTCSLTWTNVRVRPTAGTPLANGNLTKTGTATLAAVTASSTSFGTLTEVAGAANLLAFTTQPGSATAGAPFGTQPVVRTRDKFGNNSTAGLPASAPLTLTLTAGTGPLLGTTSLDIGTGAGNGVVTFSNLEIDAAGTNKQLTASASGFTSNLSSVFTVSATTADHLVIQTQPSVSATAGIAFTQQPILRVADQFGNLVSSDNSTVVTAARGTGTAALQGTTSRTAVNGIVAFNNLSYNVAETITINFTTISLAGATSSNIVVSAAPASRLTIQSQPSPAAVAGVAFAQQPIIRIEDQFGNLRSSDNATVVTAARAAGSGTLQGSTSVAALGGVVAFTNLSHPVATNITIAFSSGSLTGTTSSAIAVGPAPVSALVFARQPGSSTAGSPFVIQPAVKTQDRFGNDSSLGLAASVNVTLNLTSGSGPLQGTTILDIGASAGNGLVSFSNLEIDSAGTNKQLTASASGLTSGVSSLFTVDPASADHLAIQTQPPPTATAGVAFAPQPIIWITDAFGNRVSADNSTVVTAVRAAGTGALQGTTSRPAVNGVVTFTNLSYNLAETMSLSFAGGTLTGATSSNVVVSAGPAGRLTIQTQPSTTATAGVAFAQQPVVRVEDQFGNLRVGDNTTAVTATRAAGSGTLQGTATATAFNGLATFTNLSANVATNISIQFTSGTLTSATSGTIVVGPGPFIRLQILAPGESASPGSPTGKTGTPATQSVGTPFSVTVNAVDANWNPVNTVADLVGFASSDPAAALPASAALAAGTQTFSLTFNTTGSQTVTATDLTDGTKSANTSSAIAVSAAQYTAATGGSAISADTTGGTFTALTGPTYSENASGNIGAGTIILNAPGGFIFDTGGTAPSVLITRLTGSGSSGNNVNGITSGTAVGMTSVTTTQLVFTVTSPSASGITCKLTWQNVRVRPTAGTPLASGNLRLTGTASLATVSTNSSFGALREIAGAASKLVMQAQPSATATAGVVFAQQPVIAVQDRFGNVRSTANGNSDNSTLVTAARSAGSGTLQGTTSLTAVGGVVTYTNLSHTVATNITVSFTSGSLTNVTSSNIAISPAAASQLAFAIQPANGTVGALLATQPVVRSQDAFGNNSVVGLPASLNVFVSLTGGAGPLLGTTTLDIGTASRNGTAMFTDLRIDAAGTNKQLTVTDGGFETATSSVFTVAKGNQSINFGVLSNKTYGDVPFTVTATASSGLPVSFSIVSGPATVSGNTVTITGAGTVTVRAAQAGDANWNAATSVNQSFVVAKAVLSVTAANKTRNYGATNPVLTASYNGFVNGETNNVLTGTPSLSTTATPGSPLAGSPYPITVTQGTLAAANYSFSFVNGSLSINPATLTVAAVNQSRAYSATNPPLTASFSGFVNGENAGVLSGSPLLVTPATTNSPVAGSPYSITVTNGTLSAANYAFSFVNGSLTVTGAVLTVTADNLSKVYGVPNPPLTASYSGYVNGEDESILTGSPDLSTTANAASTLAGSPYPITVGPGTLSASNYTLAFVNGTLTITPFSLSVVANGASRSYGQSNPAFTGTLTGVQNGDNITAAYASSASNSSAPGTYAIVPTLIDPAGKLTNYTVFSSNGTLLVTTAALSVTANDATRAYGQTNPVFTGTLTGVQNGDNVTATYASSATAGSAAGAYAVVPSLADPGGKLGNYSVSSTNGALTVTPANLTVTADNATRLYGAPDPVFTAGYSGFVNGEVLANSGVTGNPGFSTTATPTSSVAGSPYAILPNLGTLSATNYVFNFVPAQLTITRASAVNLVTSSANPSPTGASLTLTAALSAVAPSTGFPAGLVQFMADGLPLGAPVGLSGGVAHFITSSLTHGTHSIAANYAGNGNFFGATNGLGASLLINAAPVANPAMFIRPSNTWFQIRIADLLTNYTSDADGDTLSLVSVGAGTNGATVIVFGDSIYYLPPNSGQDPNAPDHLAYTVADGYPGGLATNLIGLSVNMPVATPARFTSIQIRSNGIQVTFTGQTGSTYRLQRATPLLGTNTVWGDIASLTMDGSGLCSFTDTNAPPGQAIYRAVCP